MNEIAVQTTLGKGYCGSSPFSAGSPRHDSVKKVLDKNPLLTRNNPDLGEIHTKVFDAVYHDPRAAVELVDHLGDKGPNAQAISGMLLTIIKDQLESYLRPERYHLYPIKYNPELLTSSLIALSKIGIPHKEKAVSILLPFLEKTHKAHGASLYTEPIISNVAKLLSDLGESKTCFEALVERLRDLNDGDIVSVSASSISTLDNGNKVKLEERVFDLLCG